MDRVGRLVPSRSRPFQLSRARARPSPRIPTLRHRGPRRRRRSYRLPPLLPRTTPTTTTATSGVPFLFPTPSEHYPADDERPHDAKQQHAADDDEHAAYAGVGRRRRRRTTRMVVMLILTTAPRVRVQPARRALVARAVEVRDLAARVLQRVLPGSHTAHSPGTGAGLLPMVRVRMRMRIRSRATGTGTILVRGAALGPVCAPPAAAEETGRRALERAASAAEARRGASARWVRRVVGGSGCMAVMVRVLGVVVLG